MSMEYINIKDEHIKLGQALKLSGLVDSGTEAKLVISEGRVRLNDETVLQRGKKVFPGDIITCNGQSVEVRSKV